ncbi:hypothetical protein G9A89_013192 [Geosiphon pyriformis]|nr:hypothetical protein G9A89_013192 [Geosiphon pyriformis]
MRTRIQLKLNVSSPTHHPKGNVGGKIAFRQKTPDNTQKWKEKLPLAYWFYKIGKQLDLKTLYKDLSQKIFNKEAIQQVEKFVRKNNLTLYYKAAYRLYATFQYCPNFEDLQKTILDAIIEHYTNKDIGTDIYDFTGAQF